MAEPDPGSNKPSDVLPYLEGGASLIGNELLDCFTLARSLQYDYSTNHENLAEFTDQREIEIDEVNRRYAEPITARGNALAESKRAVEQLWHETSKKAMEGFMAGQISGADLIFTHGLLVMVEGNVSFDYDRAAVQLARFRQLQPGTQVLLADYYGSIGDPKSGIRGIELNNGGTLAEKPEVLPLSGSSGWTLNPKISLKFTDGRKASQMWEHKIAIGQNEAETVASRWLDEHPLGLTMNFGDIRHIAEGLTHLRRTGIDLPTMNQLQTAVLEALRSNAGRNPNNPDLLESLPYVSALDSQLCRQVIKQIALHPDFSNDEKLTWAIAQNNELNLEFMPEPNKDLARAKAAVYIAWLRIDAAKSEPGPG
jgi:hypothetical protein